MSLNSVETAKVNWKFIENLVKSRINSNKNYEQITEYNEVKQEDVGKYQGFKNAAHALIWAKNTNLVFDVPRKEHKAAILMNWRFDGIIGFPGGFVDEIDASIVDGLNRELKEEINLDTRYLFTNNDLLFIHVNQKRKIILHFYAKMFQYEDFLSIEKRCLDSDDWGIEVLGVLRPPLYKMEENSERGFPKFIKNEFIGNTLLQLYQALICLDILDKNELISII